MSDMLRIEDGGREVWVAHGAAPAGRLHFVNGAAGLTLNASSELDTMLHARFGGTPPKTSMDAETVTFGYPRLSRPFEWRGRSADVQVSTKVPWEIDLRGGANVTADLRGLELLEFRIDGGASQVEIELPPPIGAVQVSIRGGASQVRIRRPGEVPVRVQVRGGAAQLTVDEQTFGAIGGKTQLQSDGFREEGDRYEISIGGGASKLTVERT